MKRCPRKGAAFPDELNIFPEAEMIEVILPDQGVYIHLCEQMSAFWDHAQS